MRDPMEIYDFHDEDELVSITKAKLKNKLWGMGVLGLIAGITFSAVAVILFLTLSDTIVLVEVH